VTPARFRFLVNIGMAVAAFGSMPFFKKFAIESGVSGLMVAQVSGAVAALTALGLRGLLDQGSLAQLTRGRNLADLALVGVLTAGVVVLLNALALEDTTATNRSLFQALYPFATAVFAWALLSERLRPVHYALMGAAAIGLFLMNRGSEGFELGVGFWLLAATLPLIGFSDAYAKRRMRNLGPDSLTAGRFLFGGLFLLLTLPLSIDQDWSLLAATWPWLVLAGIASVAGVIGLYRAMQSNSATLAAMFASLSPLVTAALEWTFLGTSFLPWQWAGMLIVIAAAILLARLS
jgi:drug/metabolite transporter (DMT)-like permease